MIATALFALLFFGHPTDPSLSWPDPPDEMIDFLGRRLLCLDFTEPPARTAFAEEEWQRLRCSELAEEEADYRSRFASNRDVLRWLDQNPAEFRLPRIVIRFGHGPPPADVRSVALNGVDIGGRTRFRLIADKRQAAGRHTTLTVSFANLSPRTFTIDNRRFPGVDLQSLRVSLGGNRSDERLIVGLHWLSSRLLRRRRSG